MRREIYIETFLGRKRMAVIEDGVLAEYAAERPGQEKRTGSIYKGLVRDVLPGMQAAFVDIGLERNAFLPFDEVAQAASRGRGEAPLRRGQEVLVQVTKESGGSKGVRVSCAITLTGALVVLLPTGRHTGLSRKITGREDRERLEKHARAAQEVVGCGLILRTAALDASSEEILQEAKALSARWAELVRAAEYERPPKLLLGEEQLECRMARDLLTAETERVWFDDDETLASAQRYAGIVRPAFAGRLKRYPADRPMFETEHIDSRLERATGQRVRLPGGGEIVIEHTEALTAVDVNSGAHVVGKGKNGAGTMEETALAVNLEAAAEIARQLRLRDVGGIVAVDFIDMEEPTNVSRLEEAFGAALAKDRAKTNMVGISKLGVAELTRHAFQRAVGFEGEEECGLCRGSGRVPTAEKAAHSCLRKLYTNSLTSPGTSWLVSASASVTEELLKTGQSLRLSVWVFTDKTKVGNVWSVAPASPTEIPKSAVTLGKNAQQTKV